MFSLNRNWGKVLMSEVIMVVLSLGVFFLCRMAFDMEYFNAVSVAAVVTLSTAVFAFVASSSFSVAAFVATTVVIIMAAVDVAIGGAVVGVIVVVGFIIVCAANITAEDYIVPKFLVVMSYSAEAAFIFFPIFLWG